MTRAGLVAAMMLVAAFELPASAQVPSDWMFGLQPGVSIPVGSAERVTKNSFMLQGSAEYRFRPALTAGLELGYTVANQAGNINGMDFTSNVNSTIVEAAPFVRLSAGTLDGGVGWRRYLIFGMGFYPRRTGEGTRTFSATGTQTAVPEGDWRGHLGFNGGFGAVYCLSPSWGVGLDLRYHHIFTNEDIDFSNTGSDPFQMVVASGRLEYRF
jgi:hypothetical protein